MPSPSADGRGYPRAVTLADGGTVSLRLMAPDDGDRLVAFARELPPDDLLFLSVDITDPEAVGALGSRASRPVASSGSSPRTTG